jgi:HK97 family phage major capsid protein
LSEIRNEGYTGVELEIERQVFAGTGTTPEMQGITDAGIAAAFTSTSLSGETGVLTPDIFGAMRAAIMQIREANYEGTAIFIHPSSGAAMDLAKDSNGAYVLPPFISADRTLVKGIPIYESTLVTAGNMLVGDFRKDLLLMKRGIEIGIFDQNEDDPLYDRKTIVVSCRAVNRIKSPDYNAFVYDEIKDIIAAIEKVIA